MAKENDKDKKIKMLMEDIALLEEHVRELFSFAPLGMILVSPEGVILDANSALSKIMRKDSYDLTSVPVEEVFPKDIFKETVEKGFIDGKGSVIYDQDGNNIPVKAFSRTRKDKEDNVTGYFFTFLDMTEIEKMNDKLKESKEVLEIKVAARTRELQELAENLELQVNKRTTELQDKVHELENMNRLMVGRELRMVDIKEKLNRTEKELRRLKEGYE